MSRLCWEDAQGTEELVIVLRLPIIIDDIELLDLFKFFVD